MQLSGQSSPTFGEGDQLCRECQVSGSCMGSIVAGENLFRLQYSPWPGLHTVPTAHMKSPTHPAPNICTVHVTSKD